MTDQESSQPGRWSEGELPQNVRVGVNTIITGGHAFKRFNSRLDPALIVGAHCTIDGAHFALGLDAKLHIGDYCYFTSAVLLCELEVRIGNFVVIGWNTTIADTDFHPIEPAERIADAIFCSPIGKGMPRPEIMCKPVIIEDLVWIGPNATILKGVHIGKGAYIEAGSLLTQDVPPRAKMAGNPARIVGEV